MYELRYFLSGVHKTQRFSDRLKSIEGALSPDILPLQVCKIDAHGNNKGAIWHVDDHASVDDAIKELNELKQKELNKESVK